MAHPDPYQPIGMLLQARFHHYRLRAKKCKCLTEGNGESRRKTKSDQSFSNTSGPSKGHKLKLLDKALWYSHVIVGIIKANSLSPALLAGLSTLNSFIKIDLTLSV